MATIVLCSVASCGKEAKKRGLCHGHYHRLLKYGDPTGKPESIIQNWLRDVAIPYEGDDCLIWPFARQPQGYGLVTMARRGIGAHVLVIEATKGRKTDPTHECRHLCGNGHLGCVNKRHLEWGTRKQNFADRVVHGTARIIPPRYGKTHHNFKATDEIVAKIKADLSSGMTQRSIGAKHGVSQQLVHRIYVGKDRFAI